MKKRILFAVLFVMLVTPACLLPGALFGGGGNIPPELEYIFDIPSEPVWVTATLDSGKQAEALVPPGGGSVNVTGTDGTVFRLDIPDGALITDTLIRMTPVSQLDGMPFGSEAYAVQFEPEGLQLYALATLTITPAQEIPLDQQIFFGYQGAGDNFTLAAPVMDSREIKIVLDHFSGYGVSKGFLADIEPVRQRIGGDAESRIRSAMAELLTQERQRQFLGNGEDNPEFAAKLEELMRQYEEQVVKPRIAAAGESCAAGRLAIQTVLGYERQRQLLGMSEDGVGASLMDNGLMDTVAEVCMKEEYEMCRDDHVIHRILPAWLGLERQYQLLGLEEGGARPAALENAKEYVRKCLTFELQFHSEVSVDSGYGGGYDSAVESKVKLQFNPDDISIKGQAPLVNTAFTFKVPECSVTSNRGGSTFEAISLAYIPDTKSLTDTLGYVRDFKLIYFPEKTTESFTVACEDSPPYTSPPSPMWWGHFMPAHESELDMSSGGFLAADWEIFGGEYFAKKEWIKETHFGVSEVEVGTFKLYHKPQ
jgi:hypothetical protein